MDEFPICGAHFDVIVRIFVFHESAYTSVRVTLGTEKKKMLTFFIKKCTLSTSSFIPREWNHANDPWGILKIVLYR